MNVLGGECGRALCPSSSYHLWKQPEEMVNGNHSVKSRHSNYQNFNFFFHCDFSKSHQTCEISTNLSTRISKWVVWYQLYILIPISLQIERHTTCQPFLSPFPFPFPISSRAYSFIFVFPPPRPPTLINETSPMFHLKHHSLSSQLFRRPRCSITSRLLRFTLLYSTRQTPTICCPRTGIMLYTAASLKCCSFTHK